MPGLFDDFGPAVAGAPRRRRARALAPEPFDPLAELGGGFGAPAFVEPFQPPPVPPPPPAPEPAAPVDPLNVEPDEPGILGTIGRILDTPGRFVRQGITGKKDASGRDVLRSFGWENDDNEGFFTPAGIAGFATELALDPLNLLPGFFGLKAATRAGKAAELVATHLDDADRAYKAAKFARSGLQKEIQAAETASKVIDEAAIADRVAKLPKYETDLLGEIARDGVQIGDRELVERLATRQDKVGEAARAVLENTKKSGVEAFRPLKNAGERVKAGQEALFSVGGEVDPFGLLRIGGKYNPVNWLPKVPGLTAPLELPQKTLIEGADAAQKIQDIGRGIGELPGIKQAKALFAKVPGAPLASREALENFSKDARTDARAGGAAAEDAARALDAELQGLGKVELPAPKLPEAPLQVDGEMVDPITGEILGREALVPEPPAPQPGGNILDDLAHEVDPFPNSLPPGWDTWRMPEFPAGMQRKPSLEGARTTPLQDVNDLPKYEDFETPRKGHIVRFSPRDATSNPAGLRRPLTAKVEQIFDLNGRTLAQLEGGWHVPIERIQRPIRNVKADWQRALDDYERERMWKGKTPTEIRRTKARARDARSALEQIIDTGELQGIERNAALKSDRNDILKELGIENTGDLEQAQALPKVLERALQKGHTPNLKTVDFLSLESGAVSVGDEIKLAGDTFEIQNVDPQTGLVRLQDGIPIDVPLDRIPVDKGAPIQRAVADADLARRAESFDPLAELAASAPTEAPRVASGIDVGGAEAVQPKKFAKLNKAADVLARAEAKVGVEPVDLLEQLARELPEPQTVADLGKSEIPDVAARVLQEPPPANLAAGVGEASNPPDPFNLKTYAQERADAAARATDNREALRRTLQQKPGEAVTEGELERFRALDSVAQREQQTARAAETLASAGERLDKANATAREMMAGRSLDAGAAITEALEQGDAITPPPEIAGTVKRLRNRYDEIMAAEKDITPELVDARVKYVTHVPTEEGAKFFRRMSKNRGQQAQLFVELEKKRMGAGLAGDVEAAAQEALRRGDDLPSDPALRAEILAERAKAKRRPGPNAKPVPASAQKAWAQAYASMDPAARKFIEDNGLVKEYLDFAKDFSLEHGSQIPRLKQYKGLTVNELNDVMGKFGSRGPVYNPNPAAQLYAREIRHAKVMAGKSFLENVAGEFGNPNAPIADVMKSLADDSISPEGFRQMMGIEDPQTAKAAFDTLKRLTDEEELGQLVETFDKITRGWKGWITRGFPAFHVRNHISNRLQAWLTGVPLAGEHIQLGHKLVGGVDFKVALGDGKLATRDELLKEMQQTGVLKGGFFEQNLRQQLDETASKWNPLNPDNFIVRGAERVSAGLAGGLNQLVAGNPGAVLKMDSNAIEGADRASVYIHWRKQGLSPRAAAQKVDEALFDYSKENLSPFEQNILNRGVFFYGYMRNVLPFIARAVSENGAKVAQMLKLGTQPGRPDFVPEYAASGLQLGLGQDADGNSKMAYSLGTPIEAAVEPFAGNPLSLLNPMLKIPLELLSGKDFFLGKDIADATKAPNYVDNLPESLQDLLGTVKTPTKSGGERVEIDPLAAYALRNNPLSRVGTTASKIFDERKDPLVDILPNLFSGSRVVSIDDEQEKAWRIKDRAKERLRELEREGRAKVGKYESFGRAAGAKKGQDEEVDYLLRLANGR